MATPNSPAFLAGPTWSRRLLAGAWILATAVAGTVLAVLSHMGVPSSGAVLTRLALHNVQRAGFLALALLLAVLLALALFARYIPVVRHLSRKLAFLCVALVCSGVLWTFLCAIVAQRAELSDFWRLADLGGFVAFVLWLRTLTDAWRGARILLAAPLPRKAPRCLP